MKTTTHKGWRIRVGDDVSISQLHPTFKDKIFGLLNDSRLSGLVWVRSGVRTNQEQVALRRRNCGTSRWAIYYKRPSKCKPPTARPGTSRHETRKDGYAYAVDLDFAPHSDNWGLLHTVARDYGVHFPVSSEGWHAEPTNAHYVLPVRGHDEEEPDVDQYVLVYKKTYYLVDRAAQTGFAFSTWEDFTSYSDHHEDVTGKALPVWQPSEKTAKQVVRSYNVT